MEGSVPAARVQKATPKSSGRSESTKTFSLHALVLLRLSGSATFHEALALLVEA
jgi:hypothetical protein